MVRASASGGIVGAGTSVLAILTIALAVLLALPVHGVRGVVCE